MPASQMNADSLLTIDVGTLTSRVTLFDMVEGHYRFIAACQAQSTAAAPFRDLSIGVVRAIENLQTVTGRTLLGAGQHLIVPSREGSGVDSCAVTLSAGPAIKTVLVGLLDDISLESLQRLARSTYTRVVDTIGMNDRRKPEEQIDGILRLRPDLILIAGGTEGGATRSVQKLIEVIGLACYLLPVDERPAVLFAGNRKIASQVKYSLEKFTPSLSIFPNIRPTLEFEDLQPAQSGLASLSVRIRGRQMGGLEELSRWAGGTLMPTASAQGRIIQFLSKVHGSHKGILCVDVGASAVTIAAGFDGDLTLNVYPQLGLGEGLASLLHFASLKDITRWLPLDISPETIRDYLYQKSFYPATIPATVEEMSIGQALARQTLSLAFTAASRDFPDHIRRPAPGLTPYFEPIIAGGNVITNAPTLGQALLILLDAIQPVGITSLILDQNNLLPAMGAASSNNAILPVQVLESGAFLGLASVIAPLTTAHPGTPILRLRLVDQNGSETNLEIKNGALEILPLPAGQTGHLYLRPLHHTDVGFGQGRLGDLKIKGTALGLVIDARGRPLRFPADDVQRRKLLMQWLSTAGG